MLKLLDLFSGIGGFSLGLESTGGFETIAFVEKDDFCQKVLKKHWPNTTIEGDIRNVKGDKYEADVITGGFPCQPFSVAGKRKGVDDDRYLWDETIRVVRECKPKWFIGENVEGLININNGLVLRQVQTDLEKEGFEVQCLIIPASGIGAWHQRKRIWIMAYSNSNGHRNKIKGINGEKKKIQDQHRQNNSASRQFSGTSSIRNANSKYVSNSISTRSGRGRISGNVDKQGRNAFEAERKSIQSKNEQTCSDDVEQNGQNVSDTNNSRNRTSQYDIDGRRKKINERWEELSQPKSSRYSKDVPNSESISSNDGRYGNDSKEKQIQFKTRRESSSTNVSNPNGNRKKWNKSKDGKGWWFESFNNGETLSNSNNKRLQGLNSKSIIQEQKLGLFTNKDDEGRETWWQTESRICGVPNGVSFELDKTRSNRIKSLGNSIVPQIVRELGFAILEAEK